MTEPETQWTNKGFNQVFDELIKTGMNYTRAYLEAEEQHIKKFGKIRYKSYDSFRSCRSKLLFNRV